MLGCFQEVPYKLSKAHRNRVVVEGQRANGSGRDDGSNNEKDSSPLLRPPKGVVQLPVGTSIDERYQDCKEDAAEVEWQALQTLCDKTPAQNNPLSYRRDSCLHIERHWETVCQ